MTSPSFREYLSGFKFAKSIVAGIGVLLPGLSYFTSYPPPLLDETAILTSALAALTVIITYYYNPQGPSDSGHGLPPLVKLARKALLFSLILLVLYLLLLPLCTVVAPGTRNRFQIGFGKASWSLTDEGKRVKAQHPNETVQDWMEDDALFRPGGPDVIWKTWTISLFGVVMIVTFILAFILWTFVWSLLAKQRAIDST
jgi:hypothetical protein